MNILENLTPGTLLFLVGAAMASVATFLTLWSTITAGRKKRKMDQRMREKY